MPRCLDSDNPERAIKEGKLAWWRDVAEFGHDPFEEFLEPWTAPA